MMVATMAAAAVTPQNTCLDRPQQLLVILGLLIEALLFGMFTSCMMCTYPVELVISLILFVFTVSPFSCAYTGHSRSNGGGQTQDDTH
jgi:hypothetical protein